MATTTLLAEGSRDSKLTYATTTTTSPWLATYRPIESTCPLTCALRGSTCYACTSYYVVRNAELSKTRHDTIARPHKPRHRFLRGNVSGDSVLADGVTVDTAYINELAECARINPQMLVYSYTHSRDVALYVWREMARPKNLGYLYSCDTEADVRWALDHDIPYARIADDPVADRRAGEIACPHYAHGTRCERCTVCVKVGIRPRNVVLARI